MGKIKQIDLTAKYLRSMLSGKDLDELSAILTLLRLATDNAAIMSDPSLSLCREQAYRIKALVQD